ncbi:MAG: pantoate--beta-alanine ligase [Gammaproteobacteria bacterium]
MDTAQSIAALRQGVRQARHGGRRIAFVPTMGNLHAGHLALVARAREVADYTVVSIFVNPFQFGEGEDFLTYPRTVEEDCVQLEQSGVDLLFLPEAEEIYPEGPARCTRIEVPELGDVLCGAFRPTFFRGVATVVGILFNAVAPDVALFGEKDYQQLILIRRMVRDLKMAIEVLGVPTIRERDGLAMSSRNRYLSEAQRGAAPSLYVTLCELRDTLRRGASDRASVEAEGIKTLQARGLRPDYLVVRRAVDLDLPQADDKDVRILAAAWLGRARLIDNIAV